MMEYWPKPRADAPLQGFTMATRGHTDRKSTRLNSSHSQISYAVFCLNKKKHRICRRPQRNATLHYWHRYAHSKQKIFDQAPSSQALPASLLVLGDIVLVVGSHVFALA